MDSISLDSENPFLYVAGAASISMLINIYCCLRNCKNRNNKVITKNSKNSKISEIYGLNDPENNSDNIELTNQFTNIVLPSLPETPTNTPTNTPESLDIEMGNPTPHIETTEMTTQTEDCELYEMMGNRFNDELDYYKKMNMKQVNK